MQTSSDHHPSLVSIIMAAYNSSKYISEAIQSILEQTHDHWELLIVSDGSTDNTLEIANSFSDQRVRVFSQENRGVSAARNLAISKMKGDYFCFLDADDVLPMTSLSHRLKGFTDDPTIGFVDGQVIYTDEHLNPDGQVYTPKFRGLPKNQLLRLNRDCLFGNTWMIKYEPDISYHFDTELTHAEDLFFYLSVTSQSNLQYTYTEQPVLLYRNNPHSAMSNLDGLEKGYQLLINKISRKDWATTGQLLYLKFKITKIMFLSHCFDGRNFWKAIRALFKFF